MSDGPHRSLPMRPAWKKVAEWADNPNFDCSQVAARMAQAIIQDFRREIPDEVVMLLKKEFKEREADLFPDHRTRALASIEQALDGSPLGRTLLDCVEQGLAAGEIGQHGLENAMKSVVHDRMLRAERQIEEHYQRHHDSSMARAANVRDRLEEAIQLVSAGDVAGQVLRLRAASPSRAGQRSGLDDGVPLR